MGTGPHDTAAAATGPLNDTPLGPGGLPLRCSPPWRRSDREVRRVLAQVEEGARTTPVLGGVTSVEGVDMVEATFLWKRDGSAGRRHVYLHLNTLTDNHRELEAPEAMSEVDGTDWWALDLLLPADALIGYRIVASADALPADAGTTRAGWKRVHEMGEPDRFNPVAFQDGFALRSSLFVGPRAEEHPLWRSSGRRRDRSGASVSPRLLDVTAGVVPDDAGDRRVTLVQGPCDRLAGPPGRPGGTGSSRLLILLDGEQWRGHEVTDRLAGELGAWSLMLLDAGTLAQRRVELTDPRRWTVLLKRALEAAQAAGAVNGPEDVVVAGQSLGGLVAADAALRHPELCAGGIAQSPSLWVGSGRDRAGEGELLTWLRNGGGEGLLARERAPRLVLQSGSHEGVIRAGARRLAQLARQAGARISYREIRGGHDYGWWRSGLSWGMDAWAARPAERR